MRIPALLVIRTACFAIPTMMQALWPCQAFVQPHAICNGRWLGSLQRQTSSRSARGIRLFCSQQGVAPEGDADRSARIRRVTLKWVEDVIVGLRLCPWANSVLKDGAIKVVVSEAEEVDELMEEIKTEMGILSDLPAIGPNATTLIVTDRLLDDFFDYNTFANEVDEAIDDLDLRDSLQVATFHPDYQFGGTGKSDPENWTNRSPFPIFHLLVKHAPFSPHVHVSHGQPLVFARSLSSVDSCHIRLACTRDRGADFSQAFFYNSILTLLSFPSLSLWQREVEVTRAVESYDDTDKIWQVSKIPLSSRAMKWSPASDSKTSSQCRNSCANVASAEIGARRPECCKRGCSNFTRWEAFGWLLWVMHLTSRLRANDPNAARRTC